MEANKDLTIRNRLETVLDPADDGSLFRIMLKAVRDEKQRPLKKEAAHEHSSRSNEIDAA